MLRRSWAEKRTFSLEKERHIVEDEAFELKLGTLLLREIQPSSTSATRASSSSEQYPRHDRNHPHTTRGFRQPGNQSRR